MGKKYRILTLLFAVVMLLTGCGREGKLDEGDCPVEVRLAGLPTGYAELTEDAKEQVQVTLRLENVVNEKQYTFKLTNDNHFAKDASLNPGKYRVVSCYMSGSGAVRMEVEASVESMDISRDTINIISVSVKNEAEFNQWIEQMRVDPRIMRADQFSRVVQFEGQVFGMEQIMDYVEFDYAQQVRSYGRVELSNAEKGVNVTLLNDTDEPQDWENCRVIGVGFTKDNVIFGKGVRVRMLASQVLHAEDGLYGKPDALEGCVLIGGEYEDFDAIYHDAISGDRMKVKVDSSGDHISGIAYEFEVFE